MKRFLRFALIAPIYPIIIYFALDGDYTRRGQKAALILNWVNGE